MSAQSLPTPHALSQGELIDPRAYTLLPPGPPRAWARDALGRPCWIARLADAIEGRWVWLVPPAAELVLTPLAESALQRDIREGDPDALQEPRTRARDRLRREVGPIAMPAITQLTPRVRRRGHPGVGWTSPDEAMVAAWLTDVAGLSRLEVAGRLALCGEPSDERECRRKASGYVAAGRQALCDRGAWPWITPSFEQYDDPSSEGEPLPMGWWQDEWVLAHLVGWYQCACLDSDPSAP